MGFSTVLIGDLANSSRVVYRSSAITSLSGQAIAPGRDRGIDILAYPDALGFERSRIKVQVKHRRDKASGPEMRSFLGALRTGVNLVTNFI
jgi:predicted Mrr-cat superfamily restriction endonuclease